MSSAAKRPILSAAALLACAGALVAAPPQMVVFMVDPENDLLPNASCGGEGLAPNGSFWEFQGETTTTLTATTAGATTSGSPPGHNVSASASVTATLSPTGITAGGSASVSAPIGYVPDFVTAAASFSLTLSIAEATTFTIEQTGNLNIADFSPITGSIMGDTLTAGTYRLSLGVNALLLDGGGTFSRAGTFNVILGGGEDCPADWNDDGQITSSDISAFLTAWLASLNNGNLIADFNADNTVNSSDISAFLTRWLAAVTGNCNP